MHSIWKKEKEFEDFIRDTASKVDYPSVALYANVVLVESYFEFITRILLEQFELSEEDEDKWKQSNAIDQLAGKNLIDQNDKEIFHAVRKLRNKVVHNIRFNPDLKGLKEFMQCLDEELDPADECKCKSSSKEIERIFCHKVVTAYSKISNKYKHQVDEKIAYYIKTHSGILNRKISP